MSNQTVLLITGACGFLGSHLVPILIERTGNSRIIAVGRSQANIGWKRNPKVQFVYGDLTDLKVWGTLPRSITHVFHLAAVMPRSLENRNRASIAQNNLLPLVHLIEVSQTWLNLQQVVFSSSISVYAKTGLLLNENSLKEPPDVYGASKLAGEHLMLCLASDGIRVASLRYSSLYGYGQYQGTVLPVMVRRAIQQKELLIYGEGKRTQDFLHIEDAALACLLAFETEARGVFNIGSGVSVTMQVLAQTINRVFSNNKARITYLREKEDQDPGFRVDISRAKRELHYQPSLQVEEGLLKLKKEMGVH